MRTSLDPKRFIDTLKQPQVLVGMSTPELEAVSRYARRAGLLANLAERAESAGVHIEPLSDIFAGARKFAREHSRRIEWELLQLAPLASRFDCPVLVLKGGAYLAIDLPSARGRLVSDLDLMVPGEHIGPVEALMLENGFQQHKQDDYDQHYYRAWMHEIPPMSHLARGTTVDLHHNIAPPVSRLKVDVAKLFESAVPLEGFPPFRRLGDQDLVLHLCIHMFHDGELHNVLRELFDLDAMLRRFGAVDAFWTDLLARARQLEASRPLYYGVFFARKLLGTPVPPSVVDALRVVAPTRPMRWLIQSAMQRAILPEEGERPQAWRLLAEQLLLVRAHWLRMPPMMLMRHLWTQVRRRGGLKTAEQAAGGQHGV